MKEDELANADITPIITIGKVFSEPDQMWLPCLKDENSHDIDPVWVSSIMYLILDRYTGCVPDQHQVEFYETTLKIFETMKEHGHEYLLKVKTQD